MQPREPRPSQWAEAMRYMGYGLTWVMSTLLFLLLGSQVDRWLSTKPLFTLVGAFVGAIAGFIYMYRHLVAETRSDRTGDGGEGH